jgi:DNA-binding response OmpR family regulator
VPKSTEPFVPSTLNRNILLVEKYDVVATAIVSALKQFAPKHRFQVAARLSDAERLTSEASPDLFIIDFDPPENGVIGFFTRMRSAHPSSRALVIAPGISREVALESAGIGALQFLEKPFELTEFGDAVRRVLDLQSGADNQPNALASLHLVDLIHLICSASSSAAIVSEKSDGSSGEIRIQEGQICHAVCSDLIGVNALETMFTWRDAHFRENGIDTASQRTIEGPWSELLLNALRKAKRIEPPRAVTPPTLRAEVDTTEVGKKILIIEDTEMLLEFLEVVLRDTNPTFQVTKTRYGMEGLKQAEQVDPDLILLDYDLPDIKGHEVCQALLAGEATASIPVILMSDSVPELSAISPRFENIVATIGKPFLTEQIITLVQNKLAAGRIPRVKKTVSAVESPASSVVEPERAVERDADEGTVRDGEDRVEQTSSFPWAFPVREQPAPGLIRAAGTDHSRSVVAPRSVGSSSAGSENEVIIGIPLEVMAMQLSALLHINAVRAKPSSTAVSLQILSAGLREVIPLKIGFQLDSVTLNAEGAIASVRLVPSLSATERVVLRSTFEIREVTVGPSANDRIRFISSPAAPMTVQLLAHFQFSAAEVSKRFEIAALVLSACRAAATITLDQEAKIDEQDTIPCTVSAIELDSSSRIVELSLIPRIHRSDVASTGAR